MLSDLREKTIRKNIIQTVIVRILSMFISFLLIPITLNYITKDIYGIWLTISSIYAFLSILDIGLGNGLRVKLGTSLANQDKKLAKHYVSTIYFYLPFFLVPVSFILCLIIPYISWSEIFHVSASYQKELIIIVRIIVVSFTVRLYLSLITFILSALQKTGINSIIDALINVFVLILVLILGNFGTLDLRSLAIIYSIIPLIILMMFSVVFWKRYDYVSPKYSYISRRYFSDILSLGGKYFLIQILVLITLSSGNFIIVSLSTTTDVFNYNILQKYFSIVITLYAFIVVPLVPAFNDAYYSGDTIWIIKQMKRLKRIWVLSLVIIITQIVVSGFVFRIWLGDNSDISIELVILYGVYAAINGLSSIYSSFINGIGKTNIQLIVGIINVLLLTFGVYFLMSYFHLGVLGYVIVSIVSMIFSASLLSLQYNKVVNRKAKSVWNG